MIVLDSQKLKQYFFIWKFLYFFNPPFFELFCVDVEVGIW
jgi:hypothetical protein